MSTATDSPTLLLSRTDVERLLDIGSCIDAVEDAFRQRALGLPTPSDLLGVHLDGGAFHVKTAALVGQRAYFAAKVNANFPSNPVRRGLPTIQGILTLFDAACGVPLAVMDSMSVTTLRTAAATAVAARHLALRHASRLTIAGCGVQGRAHVAALMAVRALQYIYAYDAEPAAAQRFASEVESRHGLPVEVVSRLEHGTSRSDLIVTCTTARQALLHGGDVRAGALVAAVGADNPHKHEIAPDLMRAACVVVDDLEQCVAIGDLHHAIESGVMTRAAVRAQLGDVVLDPGRGRTNEDEVVVFDSTGVAIEDVAAAAVVYERAVRDGIGFGLRFGA